MDYYILLLFVLLFACCILHLTTQRLQQDHKHDKLPLRKIVIRFIELLGRLVVIPLITSYYLYYFRESMTKDQFTGCCLAIGMFIAFISFREITSLISIVKKSVKSLIEKSDNLEDLTTYEIIVFNIFEYGIISSTLSSHFRQTALRQAKIRGSYVAEEGKANM